MTDSELKAILEALIYVTEEPVTEANLLELLGKENREQIRQVLACLIAEYQAPDRGVEVKEVANGYRLGTKPEHHEWVRNYVKMQTPPMRLSLAALETLAVIAYRQPITLPEIQEVRGVNATAVVKTLIDRKLVTTAGRKNVIGRPILYKTTKEFLMHFGLKNINELPSLEEFEELAKSEFGGLVSEDTVGEPDGRAGTSAAGDVDKELQIPLGLETQAPTVNSSVEESLSSMETVAQELEIADQALFQEDSIQGVSRTDTPMHEIGNESIPESMSPANAGRGALQDDRGSLGGQNLEPGAGVDPSGLETSPARNDTGIAKETADERTLSTDNEGMVPVKRESEE
jgi:segregation and condensation protein B